jgi:glucoamylase
MPLVWAHAEYVKLLRSLDDGQVFDTPRQTYQRYVVDKTSSNLAVWRTNAKRAAISAGKTLRIEVPDETTIAWSVDKWQTTHEAQTQATGLGMHYTDLPTEPLAAGTVVRFRVQSLSNQEISVRLEK